MDTPKIIYNPDAYAVTVSGSKIAKNCPLLGTQNIVLAGKCIVHDSVTIRGDLAPIRIGKFCVIGANSILYPSNKTFSRGVGLIPVKMGDHIFIEENCHIFAAQIGSFCFIGENSVLGRSCVLRDGCRVLKNSYVMPDSVFPPYSLIEGYPAKIIGSTVPTHCELARELTMNYYANFVPSTSLDAFR